MRIIAKSTLRFFWEQHPDAEIPLKTWYKIVEKATSKDSNDVKRDFASVCVVGNNRLVFNIKGNKYRIIVFTMVKYHKFFIRFVGTHSQYDKIDATTI